LQRDLIPVRPAAHYLMGGVATDLDGRTSLRGLYAAGEAACTGVHGANRLASNSLLEGLVFGARAAEAMLADGLDFVATEPLVVEEAALMVEEETRVEVLIARLQAAMWVGAGLLRSAATLEQASIALDAVAAEYETLAAQKKTSRRLAELFSLITLSRVILAAAEARTESRGAHFRSDFPQRDDAHFAKHSIIERGAVRFEAW
jgi:L-aspartate oxidase